jgi:hypothetical protein
METMDATQRALGPKIGPVKGIRNHSILEHSR